MVEYNCEICGKQFGNQKSHYITHINKKFPCKPSKPINQEHISTQICTIIKPNLKLDLTPDLKIKTKSNQEVNIKENLKINENILETNIQKDTDNTEKIKKIEKIEKKFKCEFCNGCFTRNTSLTRHIDGGYCKIKKQNENDEKKKIDELIELNKQLIKQNEDIKKELSQIKKSNSKSINSNTNNIKIDNLNNVKNENINIQINNYGSEKYENMDKKLFVEPMLKEIGKQIFLKMIKNVYLNPELPENHNIVITDKNRQICKIYNDNRWITTDINMINNLLSRIIYFAKEKCNEYKDNPKQTEKIKARLLTTKKYIDKCDPDLLAELINELEDGNKENKKKIKECEEFYEMIYNDTINLLHDFKDVVLKK
jgi:hypothetical protein